MSKVILSKEQITKIVNNVVSEQFDHENSIAMEEEVEGPPTERYTVAKGEDGTYYILNQVTGKIIAKK